GRVLSTNISTAIRRVISKAALEESEELYRQFFEEDLTGDYITNADGSIVQCNEAFANIFGFSSIEDAMQHNITALYGDELFRQQFLKEVRKHGVLNMHEMELQRIDGRPVHIIENVRGVFSPEGELLQTRGYMFDITERKIAEQRIREHAALLDNTQDAIIVRDLDDRVLFWNRAAESLYGWTSREALGKTMTSLIPPQSPDYDDEALRLLLMEGKWRGELEQTTKHGEEIVVESRCTVVRDERGRPKSILVVNSNITDRRKWEAERLKASKLESVGLLAGGIAHDFNNILTAIVGNISLAKVDTESNETAHMRLLRAEKAAIRAKDLTQQLLTFAKGGAPIKKAASIAVIVRDTVEFASRGAKSAVSLSVPENLWPAEVDQGQISQVIHNLIINANQAMAKGGTIFVTCENFFNDPNSVGGIGSLPFGRYVRINIQDEGKGISESDLPKIFDPYFSTKAGGSGLGLATTYSIVKKHQGQIFVESDLNRGTRFDIYLPANPALALDTSPKARQLVRGSGERVLVMDDDETIRDIVGNMLIELGYEPSFARDGNEALELYSFSLSQGSAYAAIIMDLTIPGGLGGKETIRDLLKIDPQAVAIVSSGYSNDPIMANHEKFGFRGVVAKPFRLHDLAEVLAAVLRPRREAGNS
ncbi:MAG: PAS domain S-box protein, partial [Bdellovibrionales bacterium]|nr:PAS domain S-box protein [Bdellovibrionales bacterium]